MKGQLLIYAPGKDEPVSQALNRAPTLKQLQKAVGGYIELIPQFTTLGGSPCHAFCNEEGKLKGLPINRRATQLWHDALPSPGLLGEGGALVDYLVGPIAVVIGDPALLEKL